MVQGQTALRQAPKEPQWGTANSERWFYCETKRRRVPVGRCLDLYMDTNSGANPDAKGSACYLCPQGKRNRASYASD